jgi:hypothetical protein
MALKKVISVDLVEVVENGVLQVRTKTAILENAKVQAIAASIHTAEVIAAYQAAQIPA